MASCICPPSSLQFPSHQRLHNPSACCLLLFGFCGQLWCGFWLGVFVIPLMMINFFNKSATADTCCLQSQSSDQLMTGSSAYFLTWCSTLFMLSIKSAVNRFETAGSSSSSRIFWFFISSSLSYSPFAAAPAAGQSHNVKIDNSSFERVEEFKYLEQP